MIIMKPSHIFIFITQVVLILLIAYLGGVWGNVYSNIITIFSGAVVLWTIASLGFYAHPLPEVKEGQKLVTSGPFKFVRHPIYSAGLLLTLAWAANRPSALVFAAWVALLILLLLKMRLEERSLLKNFPEYAEYKKKTKKLIPLIY